MKRELDKDLPAWAPAVEPGSAPSAARGVAALLATTAGGLVLVVAFRALYLVRFGHDPCWMNYNFLLEAKALRFGHAAEFTGLPLVPALLLLAQEAGASATAALGALYLAGHVLLATGTFALGRLVLGAGTRSRALLAILVAAVPLVATDTAYRNISCTLAAGLLAAASALVLAARGRAGALRLAAVSAVAAAAVSCRMESLLGIAGLALAVAAWGPRIGARRAAALALVVGLVAGLCFTRSWNDRLSSPGRAAASYAFYSFYAQSPLLLRAVWYLEDPSSVATEYARYERAARLLGGFAENGGSLVRALVRHPLATAAWAATKPLDVAVQVMLPDALTPLALLAGALVLRRARREGAASSRRWVPLLAAFGLPAALVIAVSDHTHYLVTLAPPLLLLAAWGIEPAVDAVSPHAAARGAYAAVAVGALAVLLAGHLGESSNALTGSAARWLRSRCAGRGCLVNALPQPIDAQAWADLQAGAPLPPKVKRSEAFVLRRYDPAYLEAVRFDRRVSDARRRGWSGPVLYVRAAVRSIKVLDDDFDPEHRLEGEPDLSGAVVVATFRGGPDAVEVLELRGRVAGSTP